MKTYLIVMRKHAEIYDWVGGYVGTVDSWSKARAIKKASKRYNIPEEQLAAFLQPD
jgi:hypothetical protein